MAERPKKAQPPSNCLDIFFASLQTHGEWPLLYTKEEKGFSHISKKEAGEEIIGFAHALLAQGIGPQQRVAFHASPGGERWTGEWGTLLSRNIAVIIARHFTPAELVETLEESKSRIVLVDTLATAHFITEHAVRELTHIVCFEGGAQAALPILSYSDFIASGREQREKLPTLLRALSANDTAILFHYKDAPGMHQVQHYTQESLLTHARRIDGMLSQEFAVKDTAIPVKYKDKGRWRKAMVYEHSVESNAHYIRSIDTVLAAIEWENPAGHLAAYYVPVLKQSSVQMVKDGADVELTEYRPHVVIGNAAYFDRIRHQITERMQEAGGMQWKIFLKVLELERQKYEALGKLSPLRRMLNSLHRRFVVKNVLKLLGGRLRLLIGIDDVTSYETKLFFHAFGVELIEVPADSVK